MVVALAAGTLLVVVTTAAYPLFLSASRDRIVETQISDPTITRYGAGITYMASGYRFGETSPDGDGLLRQRRSELFDRAVAASPVLDDPLQQVMSQTVAVTRTDGRVPASGPVNGVLFAGSDVLDHVTVIRGTDGTGAWLPDFEADPLGVGPGDTIELHRGAATVTVPVDGVYRALYTQPETGYWRIWHNDIYPCPQELCGVPPQPILVDRSQLIRLMTALRAPKATFAELAPVRPGGRLTLDEAGALKTFADRLQGAMMDRGRPFGAIFQCCGRDNHRFTRITQVDFLTAIPTVVHEAEQRTASIQGPLQVLVLAGLVIAFSVVAAAGAFALAARRVEVGVLVARGWRPIAAGAKASLEAALPCVLGGALGFALATALIGAAGPNGAIESSARHAALSGSAFAVIGAILLVGAVSAVGFASRHERREGLGRILLWFPWELLAIGAAVVLDRRLRAGGVVVAGLIQRPSASVFAFPIVLALAVSIPAARLLALALSRRWRRDGRRVSGWYLASHRLASTSALAMLFLVATSLAISVCVASLAMVSSLRATVRAKAEVFVGSDVQLQIGPDTRVPDGFPYPATTAHRVLQAGYLHGTDRPFDLLVVDPSTVASAFWNGAFSTIPLRSLAARLERSTSGALPVIVSNGAGISPTAVDLEQAVVPVDVVATTSSFPGTSSDRPVLVVAEDELSRAFAGRPGPLGGPNDSREMWIRGPAGPVRSAAARAGVVSYRTITADEVEAIPFIQAAIDTFVVLNILGAAALILVLVVSVVYLQARQRGRVLSSSLSSRMGLSRGTMRRSLTEELGALFLWALAIGGIAGWIGVGVVIPSVDPLGTIPPGPIVVRPLSTPAVIAIPLAVAAIVGGWAAERASGRKALGEVLRVAE